MVVKTIFEAIGMQLPKVLLPKQGTDMHRWAVIACDQYTSDQAYWQRLEQQTAGNISTLNLIFPEAYLDDEETEERISAINQTMEKYLADGSLEEQPPGFILVDRKTTTTASRKGLIVALDLERYDYTAGAQSLIRATEGTILDRLPPRIKVRQDAAIELPHIMVLIDDPQQTVIEPLFSEKLETVYDFELLENGGHLKGYRVDQPQLIEQIVTALEKLADPDAYHEKYNVDGAPMLYAMGDGNHSFATAKAIWEKLKQEASAPDQVMNHPARFALVELVNVHDSGLDFEAIHRVLFNVNCVHLQQQMKAFFAARKTPLDFTLCSNLEEAQTLAEGNEGAHAFPIVLGGRFGVCIVEKPEYTLTVATLQAFLDHYLEENPSARIDYIHGEKAVTDLGSKTGCVGFYLPAISKHDLFKTIVLDGALPRKTFSMGEADEKRFYLECRKIC
ncbi:DUF1015 domain-containing protein [Desulfuromusa kysingii]|uniref:DUF1015 domain-containing protein n=1 Tax=Desulfuromusa kysingii TaxID=37625 RepID=UPI003CCC3F08